MRATAHLLFCFLALLLLCPGDAGAMTVSPMQVEMTSTGQRSQARVTVVNNSAQPLPIEAVVQRLTLDEAGRQKTAAGGGEDFLVMPPQAMIPPGGTQNFRIQWLGDPVLGKSESFLLYLNQVPVRMPKGQSGVQVVMSMGVMINVAPPKGTPALKVVSTGITTDKAGRRLATLTVENPSNTHALLPEATVRLAAGSWNTTLPPAMLGDRIGIGLVQPGRRRRFTLPVEVPAGVTRVTAAVEMAGRRK